MKPSTVAGALVFTLVLSGCSGEPADTAASGSVDTPAGSGATQIANPYTEYGSLEEAATAAGFDLGVPTSISGYESRSYFVLDAGSDDAMIEVIYRAVAADAGDDQVSDQNFCLRKQSGSGDISGDYNVYTEESTYVDDDGVEYALQGDDGAIKLITWEKGGYSYSLGAYDGASLATDEVASVLATID